jgi:hypothetical protein
MVHGRPDLLLLIIGKHGELDDPRKVHGLRIVQLQLGAQSLAEPMQALASNFKIVRYEQQEVAGL